MNLNSKTRFRLGLAAAMIGSLATPAWAAISTWTAGGTSASGNLNNGGVDSGGGTPRTVTYYTWDTTTAANWGGTAYTAADDAVFNTTGGATFAIQSAATSLNPNTMTFTGDSTYEFLRANTTAGSSSWTGVSSANAGQLSDQFTSPTFSAALNTAGSITLGTAPGTGFTGKVYMEARSAAATGNTATHTIYSGALEVQDVSAVPTANTNTPLFTLAGGELDINISEGSWTYRNGNIGGGSSNFASALTVTNSSTLGNTAVDVYGKARRQDNIWNGIINVASGATLSVNTGGGTNFGNNVSGSGLQGTGTLKLVATTNANGSSGANLLKLNGTQFGAGSTTLAFDLGTSGILTNGVALAAVPNATSLGSLVAPTGTFVVGSANTASATANSSTISIGAKNVANTISGTITNGYGTSTSAGASAVTVPAGAYNVANVNLAKVGTASLAINSSQFYGGTTSVTGTGTLSLGDTHGLGDSNGAVTVNSGSTLDLNGTTQIAGKSYSLNGGSLLNNSGSATLSSGLSASYASTATTGSGAWVSGPAATVNTNANAIPSVSITGGGGSGASARVVMQLGWMSFATASGATAGSGYNKEPKISFSAPDLANGRPIKAVTFLASTNPYNTLGNAVAGITIIDPGFGYTKMPTITIDNTGTGGSGFVPVFAMTAASINVTNGGSGYTSTPSLSIGAASGFYQSGTAALVGGFGSIALTAATTSNVGGTGSLLVDAIISGGAAGNLNKVGGGVTTLTAVNTFPGALNVNAGTLLVNGTNSGGGATTVNAAILGGNGTITGSVNVTGSGTVAPGNSIGTLTTGATNIDGTFAVQYDDSASQPIDKLVSGALTLGAGSTVSFSLFTQNLGTPLAGPAYVFETYSGLSGTFGSTVGVPSGYSIDYNYLGGNQIALVQIPVPEPSTLALMVVGLGAVAFVRRRRAM
jgi:fibronectin-binding autotransporter adhesin